MPSFNTLSQLFDVMINDIERILIMDINRQLEVLFRESIYQKVYSRDSQYDRTYTLVNSVDSQVKNSEKYELSVVLWNNEELMRYTTYPSWSGAIDNRDMIVEWVNDGHSGGGDLAPQPPTNFIETARKEINENIGSILISALKRNGIEVVM